MEDGIKGRKGEEEKKGDQSLDTNRTTVKVIGKVRRERRKRKKRKEKKRKEKKRENSKRDGTNDSKQEDV